MVIGQYAVRLTEKGRTALPARFREKISDNAIIAKWYEGCLVITQQNDLEELLKRITGKSEFVTTPVRDTDRFILGSAFEITLDGQGRFVIPKMLRDYAGLKDEVIFLGLGDRIEIWDRDKWKEREIKIQNQAAELMEEIANKKGEK